MQKLSILQYLTVWLKTPQQQLWMIQSQRLLATARGVRMHPLAGQFQNHAVLDQKPSWHP